ncbi:MAG: D-glycero-beta-D-manno-heptose-7-phosphate kinase [Oligoflexia bacterium]|nr:D-glycero-beta-D-manno-heptose-7-phosphate kinase [Oligoflexia bacterium]
MNLKKVEKILDRIKNSNVLVIGDVGVDSYIVGKVDRISPEAPVPVVEVKETYHRLGLASNVVSNIVSLGGKCSIVGVIGSDPNAVYLKDELAALGVETEGLVVDESRPTTHKTRVLASKLHHVVRIDSENIKQPSARVRDELMEKLRNRIDAADVVVIEDYAKGIFKGGFSQDVIMLCNEKGKPVFTDPSRYTKIELFKGTTVFKPNLAEAQILSGIEIEDAESFVECGNRLMQILGSEYVVITRGREGMTVFSVNADMHTIPAFALEVFDVSGAGDTVIASLALAYSTSCGIDDAIFFANVAAAIVVGKVGTSVTAPSEIIKFLREHDVK